MRFKSNENVCNEVCVNKWLNGFTVKLDQSVWQGHETQPHAGEQTSSVSKSKTLILLFTF